MTHRLLLIPIVLLLCFACSKEEDVPEPVTKKKALYQVMVAFGPGQLGDRGYADNVMEGVNLLTFQIDDSIRNDTLDIDFISPWSFTSLQQSIGDWADNAVSPFEDVAYERRLLVLTEPYMIPMLATIKNELRPTDEVLLLKVNEDDVRAAAEEYGLGNRLHGLNISAAHSVRRYCRYMDQLIRLRKIYEDKTIHHKLLPYYRLYDNAEVAYRDSVYETLCEELGDSTNIAVASLSNLLYEGIMTQDGENTVIQSAFLLSTLNQYLYETSGQAFTIIDLGSANSGWEYGLMRNNNTYDSFNTLVIDGNESPLSFRCYIKRSFGFALIAWCLDWSSAGAGEMAPMTTYTKGDLCTDNITDMGILFDD